MTAPSPSTSGSGSPLPPSRLRWGLLNRSLYCAGTWCAARIAPRLRRTVAPAGSTGEAILYVAWGRIGDAILGTAALALLRRRTGRPIVVCGRAETAPVAAPLADAFVPLPDLGDAGARARFAQATRGPWFAVVSDLHLFHGGAPALGEWLAATPARTRLVYAGYAPRARVAPWRSFPAGVTVVPALHKPDTLAGRHVLFDQAHYLAAVLERLGAGQVGVSVAELAPVLAVPAAAAPAVAKIACHPFSSNARKDWPAARWRALFAAMPRARFVLLGGEKDRARADALQGDNTVNLCGATALETAWRQIAEASAFVGVDSGLAHAAAALRRPTVVVSRSSNLGYFFPYPPALGFDHVRVVHDERFAACSGCLAACTREPIWRTYRQGELCLRELSAERVHAELTRACARPHAVADSAACPRP